MKKNPIALMLLCMLALMLSAFAAQPDQGASPPEHEPDPEGHSITRTIGENQKVVYRFRTEETYILSPNHDIGLAIFDQDVEAHEQADRWCTAVLGQTKADFVFIPGHGADVPEEDAWQTPLWASRGKWAMWGEFDLDDSDLELAVLRDGNLLRAELFVDGKKAWYGQHILKNLDQETLYLYLYGMNRSLLDIEFQDMGPAGFLMPNWMRNLMNACLLAAAFGLRVLAKRSGSGFVSFLGTLPLIAVSVFVVLQYLDQIFQLIVAVLAIIVFMVIAAGMGSAPEKKYKKVTTTTKVYNDIGNLVDAHYSVDYVEDDKK